jgi:type I restriction enzyme S subunit
MSVLQIENRHLEILKNILKKYDLDIYAFGSRAKKTARPLSDLDLLIKGSSDRRLIRQMQDDFEESNLPFKVDVVVWDEIDSSFQKRIEKDLVRI